MNDQAKLLRIYTDEAAYYGDRKVFERWWRLRRETRSWRVLPSWRR